MAESDATITRATAHARGPTTLLLLLAPFALLSPLLLGGRGPPTTALSTLPPTPPPYLFPTPPTTATLAESAAFRYWDGGVPRPCAGAPLGALAAAAAALPPACSAGSTGAWRAWMATALAADCQFVGAPPAARISFAPPPANASALLLFAVGAGAPAARGAPAEAPARAALRGALAAWSLSRWAAQFRGRLEVQLLVAGAEGGLPAGGVAALAAAGGAHGATLGLDPAAGVWGAWQEGVAGARHRLAAFPWVLLASDGGVGPLTWFPDVLRAAAEGSDDAPAAAFYAASPVGGCCEAGAGALAFAGGLAATRPLWREFWQKLPAAAAAPGCGSPLPLLPRGVPPPFAADAAEGWAFCIASDARAQLGGAASLAQLRATFMPFYGVAALGEEFGEDAQRALGFVKGLWFGAVVEPCKGTDGDWGPPREDDVVV